MAALNSASCGIYKATACAVALTSARFRTLGAPFRRRFAEKINRGFNRTDGWQSPYRSSSSWLVKVSQRRFPCPLWGCHGVGYRTSEEAAFLRAAFKIGTNEVGGERRGYDGGKKIMGRKRHHGGAEELDRLLGGPISPTEAGFFGPHGRTATCVNSQGVALARSAARKRSPGCRRIIHECVVV